MSSRKAEDASRLSPDWFVRKLITKRNLLIWSITAIVFAVAGPFGSFQAMGLGMRFVYWGVITAIGMVNAVLACVLVSAFVEQERPLHRNIVLAIAFTLIATPQMMVVSGLMTSQIDYVHPGLPEAFVYVLCSFLAIRLGREIVISQWPGGASQNGRPRMADRIGLDPGLDIHHLTVDDHYVEATLSDGTTHRLLMRFSDAVQEMEGVAGFCVHRSHWVAQSAICKAYREKGRDFVQIKGDQVVPVSRTYRKNLVSAGFLKGTG